VNYFILVKKEKNYTFALSNKKNTLTDVSFLKSINKQKNLEKLNLKP
jgi:hypothetical protein